MKVSIITVTFNSEEFILNSINSVKNQDYKNLQHIIIDGNSTDKTKEILENYSDFVTWISENDNGIYDAINKGIRLATGDIVGVLNSDDFFTDNHVISRIVTLFEENKNLDSVYSNVQFVAREDVNKVIRSYSSKFFKTWMFKFGFQPAHPTFYAKKDLFERIGYYRTDLEIAGDFELLLRFLKKNNINCRYINDVWVKMRIGGISTSGIDSILKLNNEIVKAHLVNELYTNKILVYSKYLIKWWGFIFKK